MEKIAYLISAYQDPAHLHRLIEALTDGKSDFYVHIDAKSEIEPFYELLYDKVIFVKRYKTYWGGWNQVEYQKELLKAAVESGQAYKRIICLSGLDYPLWSNREIHDFFEQNKETEYIGAINLSRCGNKRLQEKVRHYHFFRDLEWDGKYSRILKNIGMVASRNILACLPFKKPLYTYIHNQKADVYFGSDYWGITAECARYVYQKLCTEKKLRQYFKSSFAPSEMCIHTIVFNSPFGEKALQSFPPYKGLASVTPLHYIEYPKQIRAFTSDDIELLYNSKKMFFRKAVSGMSDTLIARINLLRSQQPNQ